MNALRILVVSQKGGVGKSTLSANLSVWFSEMDFKNTVLLDLDPHGSSSSWVNSARQSSVFAEHAVLGDFESRRWLIDCRSRIRKYVAKSEVLVCDLTWTAAMDAELLHEFDLVIVPTSVSSIELSATIKFIESVGWVFTAKTGIPPTLLICPSRVSNDELKSIEDNGQIAVTYCDHKGNDDEKNNPNGALKNIAGIFNKNKNILGMMPHPERMIDPFLSGEDGSLFFENLIESL